MYLDPELMTPSFQQRIVRWMYANGCRHYVALEPIIVKGNFIEYVALCRSDAKSVKRMPIVDDEAVPLGRKRLRIRVPLRKVA